MSEKICEHCHQPIRKGESYAETDIGTGKWVHWPSCPPSARVFPEKEVKEERLLNPNEFIEPVLGRCAYDSFFLVNDLYAGYTAKCEHGSITVDYADPKEIIKLAEKSQMLISLAGDAWKEVGREGFGEIVDYAEATKLLKQLSEKKGFRTRSSHSNPEKPLEEVFIVDGLTLKDYYDLRDLRLMLWGLEKELIGKHGIIEAEPLASKVRELIKKKVEQISNKIGSSPEHHSNPISREEAEAEINVLIDNLAEAIRKGGEIPDYLRDALKKNFMFFKSNPGFPPQYTDFENWLKKFQNITVEEFTKLPQERKDFIYGLFKTSWGNPHPLISTGKEVLLARTEELE